GGLPRDINQSQVHLAPAENRGAEPQLGANQKHESGQAMNGDLSTRRVGSLRAAIRFGLAAIKGVGEVAVESILKARNENGRFNSLAELCERVDGRTLGRKVLEGLIKCGACDSLGQTRATLFAQIERALA